MVLSTENTSFLKIDTLYTGVAYNVMEFLQFHYISLYKARQTYVVETGCDSFTAKFWALS